MNYVSFPAMGTTVEAWCRWDPEGSLQNWFEEVEATCSRFRQESELTRINSSEHTAHSLSPVLLSVVRASDVARDLTEGLVDIGVGAAVRAWGYDRTFTEVTDLEEMPRITESAEWRLAGEVLQKAANTTLDLGGVAKGWTVDRAVEQGMAVVASAGGDLRSAHRGTAVPVLDPTGAEVIRIRVGVGALATSSIGKRKWNVAGCDVSHLVDPRTMTPVRTPIVSSTVVAATAVEAEAGAKAVLLHGEEGLAWADRQPWIRAAVVLWHDGSVYGTKGVEVAA